MGYTETTYTTYAEVVLDHKRRCEHCGQVFTVLVRALGKGTAVARSGLLSVLTDAHGSAQKAAAESARQNAEGCADAFRKKYVPHRCTFCGKFNKSDLDAMREAYSEHKWENWGWVGCVIVLAPAGVAFLAVIVFAVISVSRPPSEYFGQETPTWVWVLRGSAVVATVAIWAIGWHKLRPMPEGRYNADIDAANNADATANWLHIWQTPPVSVTKLVSSPQIMERVEAWMKFVELLRSHAPAHVPGSNRCCCLVWADSFWSGAVYRRWQPSWARSSMPANTRKRKFSRAGTRTQLPSHSCRRSLCSAG